MKPKTLILMVVAVGCGLAASYMTSRLLAERNNREQVEVEKIKILVAKKNLALGTLIKNPEDLFEERSYTKGEEPKKSIKEFEQLKDRRLSRTIAAEQFVSLEDLMNKDNTGLGASMPKGMRAFGVKVTAESTGGGFVMPNSRVDVVWVKRGGDNDSQAKIILQNVLVLAIDTMDRPPEEKQAMIASTVTLAVKPEQAELLSLAVEQGSLKLILRPFDDEEMVRTAGITPKGIAKSGEAPEASVANDLGPRLPTLSPRIPDVAAPKPEEKPTQVVEKSPEPTPAPPKTHVMTGNNGRQLIRATFILDDNDEPTTTQIDKSQPEGSPKQKSEPPAAAPVAPVKTQTSGSTPSAPSDPPASSAPPAPSPAASPRVPSAGTGSK